MQAKISTNYGFVFWFHLFITVLSWFAPFLFTWYLPIAVYAIVLMQFYVFGRCVINRVHDLSDESSDSTFYAFLLETVGFDVNHKKVKRFVRFYLYFILTAITLIWQLGLGNAPLLFFR
jgi:Na+/glutamate symporter